ncbi:MAG: hypothetical protein ACYCUY_00090 [Acidithiobacillus sp.]|jgi:hypothetical protein
MSTESVKHLFLLTVTDLAEVIKTKDSTLSERLKNHPEDFPPAMEIPGCRGFRFHPQDVADWLVELSAKALGLRSALTDNPTISSRTRKKRAVTSETAD